MYLPVDNAGSVTPIPFVEIFTGGPLPEADRRRTGLGVEPMTCAPDAFNSREGLITLEPGQTHQARWVVDPGRKERTA
ncbi:hypothetical protein ACWDFL_32070 [Streptomyces bungoensis]